LSAVVQVAERLKQELGSKREEYLGKITRLLIRRYALSIGDDNPLYYDEDFARDHGYDDIVAPPNMLASIVDWGVGAPEPDLRRDGTAHRDDLLTIEEEEVRVMGGGEKMHFHKPVVAGMEVTLTSELTDVSTKEGRKGLLTLLVFDNTYTDQHGDVLCVCTRTVIVR
jgi:acyl dehydratase